MRSFLIKSNNYSPNNLGAYNYKFELNEEESTVTLVTNNGSYELGGGSGSDVDLTALNSMSNSTLSTYMRMGSSLGTQNIFESSFGFRSTVDTVYMFMASSPQIVGNSTNNSISVAPSGISLQSPTNYLNISNNSVRLQNTMIQFPVLSAYNGVSLSQVDLNIIFPSANIEQNSSIYMTYSVNGVKANANGDIDLLGIVNEVLTGTNPTLSYMTSTYPNSPIGTIVYFLSIDTPKEYVKVSSTQWISKDINIVS